MLLLSRGVAPDMTPRHDNGGLDGMGKDENPANSSSSRIRQIVARTSKTDPAAKATARLRDRTNLDKAGFPATISVASKKVAMLQVTTSMAPRPDTTVAVLKGTRSQRTMGGCPQE